MIRLMLAERDEKWNNIHVRELKMSDPIVKDLDLVLSAADDASWDDEGRPIRHDSGRVLDAIARIAEATGLKEP